MLTRDCAAKNVEPKARKIGNGKIESLTTFPFNVNEDGIFLLKDNSEPVRLAARIDVIAETRDEKGENWGRRLQWSDAEMRLHQWTMPLDALASDSSAVRAKLQTVA